MPTVTTSQPNSIPMVGNTHNMGISYSSGIFRICQKNGSVLGTDQNAALVTIPSATGGQNITLAATSDIHLFGDSTAADSDIIGEEFGNTTGVAWGNVMPFFIYAVNADDTSANLKFAISPNPCAILSPATTNIGYADNPAATPNAGNFFFLTTTNVTTTHNAKPCVCIGSFRMTMNTSDDWTVDALSSSVGIGLFQEAQYFTMPVSQNGASSGKFWANNGGTAPVFTTSVILYKYDRDGVANMLVFMSGDGGTDGATAVAARMALPGIANTSGVDLDIGTAQVDLVSTKFLCTVRWINSTKLCEFHRATDTTGALQNNVTTIMNSDFANGNRLLQFALMFKMW